MTMSLISDLRQAGRTLRRSPGYAALAVTTLALGIGANTAIFSLVEEVLLSPLPVPEPERVVLVSATVRRESVERRTVSYPDFLDWRAQASAFSAMAAFAPTSLTLTGGGNAAERLEAELASASYFPLLGAEAALGRAFLAEEDAAPDAHPVAVVSHDLWIRRFGRDPGLVGRVLELNGRGFTVVGVLREGFRGLGDDTEVWVPMAMMAATGADLYEERGSRWHSVVARLAPGATSERAQAELDGIARRLEGAYPEDNADYGALVLPLPDEIWGELRPTLLVLLGAVAFVLAIACANVANLMLARAAARQRETAIRAALGAGRGRLVRQALVESLAVAALGGALGLLVAVWAVDLLLALSPIPLPSFVAVGLDLRVLAFSAGVALATGLAMGIVPGLQTSRPDLNETLKEGGRGSAGGVRRGRLRAALVVAEVALALLLLVGAGLMIGSFRRLQEIETGFRPEGLAALSIALPEERYDEARARAFYRALLERLRGLPAVTGAALATDVPLGGDSSANRVAVEGRELAPQERGIRIYRHMVSPGYFETAGIRILAGRAIDETDGAEAPEAVVVSETFARRTWPGESPLGKRLKPGRPESERPWMIVVGMAADVRHRGLVPDPVASPEDPDLYFALEQHPDAELGVLVRSSADPAALAAALRREVGALDRDVPVWGEAALPELVADQTARSRFAALLMGAFGGLAVLLAALGIYGLLAQSVAQRLHEIGIRMALGAARRDVAKLVLGQALGLTLAGLALGLAAAVALTRFLASLLYELSPTDPATFAGVSALLVAVALVATWLPVRRAMRMDPATTLRSE